MQGSGPNGVGFISVWKSLIVPVTIARWQASLEATFTTSLVYSSEVKYVNSHELASNWLADCIDHSTCLPRIQREVVCGGSDIDEALALAL